MAPGCREWRDGAAEAIRLARHRADGRLVPLAEQDRTLWCIDLIAEAVDVLQHALARDRLGEYQAQAAIAALHADAPSAARPTGCRSSSGMTN